MCKVRALKPADLEHLSDLLFHSGEQNSEQIIPSFNLFYSKPLIGYISRLAGNKCRILFAIIVEAWVIRICFLWELLDPCAALRAAPGSARRLHLYLQGTTKLDSTNSLGEPPDVTSIFTEEANAPGCEDAIVGQNFGFSWRFFNTEYFFFFTILAALWFKGHY